MTRVEFYFNVTDKLATIAGLCEKALAKGRQLTVLIPDHGWVAPLQQHLWEYSATSFLPSALSDDSMRNFSPIILDLDGKHLVQDDVLVNLQQQHPPFFSRFRYLVELVSSDESDKAAARLRYKFYRDRGYQIKSTDAALIAA